MMASAVLSLMAMFPLVAANETMGKWAFVGVFALLIIWLVLVPGDKIGQAEGAPPWWRNVRVWAIVVATIQMMVYVVWG